MLLSPPLPKPQYVPSQLQVVIANDFEYLLTHRKDAVFAIAGDFNSFDTCFLERDVGLQAANGYYCYTRI